MLVQSVLLCDVYYVRRANSCCIEDSNLLQRTKFFLRGRQGIESILGPPSTANATHSIERNESFGTPRADLMEISADGSKIVLVDSQTGFTVYDTDTSCVLQIVANPGIQAIAWSPLGSHLLSWQRPQKDSELGNLVVWNVANGEAVARFNQKTVSKDVSRNSRLRENHSLIGSI